MNHVTVMHTYPLLRVSEAALNANNKLSTLCGLRYCEYKVVPETGQRPPFNASGLSRPAEDLNQLRENINQWGALYINLPELTYLCNLLVLLIFRYKDARRYKHQVYCHKLLYSKLNHQIFLLVLHCLIQNCKHKQLFFL